MHDVTYANSIVTVLKAKLSRDKKPKNVSVSIVLGPFTHVTPESLRSAFSLLSEKEGFQEVSLNIRQNQAEIKCSKCHTVTRISAPVGSCPSCGSVDFELFNNEEFIIESIEIEEA